MKRLEQVLMYSVIGAIALGVALPVAIQWPQASTDMREWIGQRLDLTAVISRAIRQYGSVNGAWVGAFIGMSNGFVRPIPNQPAG